MLELPSTKRKRVDLDLLSESPNYVGISAPNEITNDKTKKLEALFEELRFANNNLKAQLEFHQNIQKSAAIDHDAKVKNLESTITQLKARAIHHKEKHEEAAEVLSVMKAKHTEDMNEIRATMENQREELANLKIQLKDESLRSEELENQLLTVSEERQNEIASLKDHVAELTILNEEKTNNIEEAKRKEIQLTDQINGLKTQLSQLQMHQGRPEDYVTLADENKSITRKLVDLEETNKKLTNDLKRSKAMTNDVELLRVEKDSLQARVHDLENLKESYYKLQLENANMKAERNAWAYYLDHKNNYNLQSPESIIQQLVHQAEKANQIDYIRNQYQAQADDQQRVINELEAHVEELKKSTIKYEQLHAVAESSKDMLNNNVNLLKKHIHILEGQLTMYDHEEEAMNEKYDTIKTQRISELQDLLNEREAEIILKNQELADITSRTVPAIHISNGPYDKLASGASLTQIITEVVAKEQHQAKVLEEKITNEAILEKRCKAADELIEQLRESLAIQQNKISEVSASSAPVAAPQLTETNPKDDSVDAETQTDPTVRILQLRENPASIDYAIRKAQLVRLEKENKALVEGLNANNTDGYVQVPQATLDNLYAKAAELEETVSTRDKRIQRLHAAFDDKAKETLEQVHRILGFKLDFRSDGLIYLESAYVDPVDLSFMVKNKDDDPEVAILRLVGKKRDEYMDNWYDIYDMHIIQAKNIAAFLNSVQVELYVDYQQRHDVLEESDQEMEVVSDVENAPADVEVASDAENTLSDDEVTSDVENALTDAEVTSDVENAPTDITSDVEYRPTDMDTECDLYI